MRDTATCRHTQPMVVRVVYAPSQRLLLLCLSHYIERLAQAMARKPLLVM